MDARDWGVWNIPNRKAAREADLGSSLKSWGGSHRQAPPSLPPSSHGLEGQNSQRAGGWTQVWPGPLMAQGGGRRQLPCPSSLLGGRWALGLLLPGPHVTRVRVIPQKGAGVRPGGERMLGPQVTPTAIISVIGRSVLWGKNHAY